MKLKKVFIRRLLILGLGLAALLPAILSAEPQPSLKLKEKMTPVMMAPVGYVINGERLYPDSLKISPDMKNVAYVTSIGSDFRVWLNGVSEKKHGGVTRQSPFFSPRNNHLAYIVQEKDHMFVVVDGQEQARYKRVGTIVFSPDGDRIAYRAEDEKGRQMVVVDGQEGPLFDLGVTGSVGIVFSPDSRHVAYAGVNRNDSYVFVKNDKKMRSFEKIEEILYSPDSAHVAYTAMEEGKWLVVTDDKKGAPYDQVGNLIFSPDSSQLVYTAIKNGNRPVIVKNNVEISDGLGVLYPIFSPDGNRFAYLTAEDNNQYRYVIDGKKELPVEQPGRLIFSHDSSATAYAAEIDKKWHMIKNGVKGPAFKKITAFQFSPVTRDIMYTAVNDDDQSCIAINNEPGKFYQSIGTPMFSPESGQYGYVAQQDEKGMFVVINKTELTTWPVIGIPMENETDKKAQISAQFPFFSPNGNRVAYAVYQPDNKKCFMVVDGKAHSIFDLITTPCFSPDEKHIVYMGKKGSSWYLVVDGKTGNNPSDGMLRGAAITFESPTRCYVLVGRKVSADQLAFYRLVVDIIEGPAAD